MKQRYVLGEGYPWAYGTGKMNDPHIKIGLNKNAQGLEPVALVWPKELWEKHVPKMRLVLEVANEE